MFYDKKRGLIIPSRFKQRGSIQMSASAAAAASGSGGARVSVIGDFLSDASVAPTDSEVGYQLSNSGAEQSYEGTGNAYITINTWLLSGLNSDYDCRLTVNTGTAPAGSATGTWLVMSTTRAWTLTDTTSIGGTILNNCTIEIRDSSTLVVLDSATVTMSVEQSP